MMVIDVLDGPKLIDENIYLGRGGFTGPRLRHLAARRGNNGNAPGRRRLRAISLLRRRIAAH
jgi:hypothetical protein